MRSQDIVIGEYYRFREHPNYSYAKALEILKPKVGVNDHTYTILKCEHVVYKDDKFGFTRYFRPVDLMKPIEIKPTKPKENGYLYKPVGGVNDPTV